MLRNKYNYRIKNGKKWDKRITSGLYSWICNKCGITIKRKGNMRSYCKRCSSTTEARLQKATNDYHYFTGITEEQYIGLKEFMGIV